MLYNRPNAYHLTFSGQYITLRSVSFRANVNADSAAVIYALKIIKICHTLQSLPPA